VHFLRRSERCWLLNCIKRTKLFLLYSIKGQRSTHVGCFRICVTSWRLSFGQRFTVHCCAMLNHLSDSQVALGWRSRSVIELRFAAIFFPSCMRRFRELVKVPRNLKINQKFYCLECTLSTCHRSPHLEIKRFQAWRFQARRFHLSLKCQQLTSNTLEIFEKQNSPGNFHLIVNLDCKTRLNLNWSLIVIFGILLMMSAVFEGFNEEAVLVVRRIWVRKFLISSSHNWRVSSATQGPPISRFSRKKKDFKAVLKLQALQSDKCKTLY
jgi:hypothetical protein